jgi:nucleoside-diphosphate-sugar epimerase
MQVLDQTEILFGDIRDKGMMQDATKGVDSVLHLAALIGIPYSYSSPQSYVDTNVSGTLNMLEAAKRNGVTRFIHTSTSEVYGTAQYVPMDEKHPLVGQSPYSASKIASDQLVHSYYSSFELPTVTLRPFNVFGPRQSSRAVIPTIIRQALAGQAEIELGNLDATRDMNYVANTVEAFLAALREESAIGKTINIGSGEERSIREIAMQIIESTGSESELVVSDNRLRPKDSEVERLLADSSLANKVFGWSKEDSNYVGFEQGLDNTIRWFSENKKISSDNPRLYFI